jgi:hypothetical protein
LKSTCAATKRNGEPCTLPALDSSGLCWAHDPKNAERRRRGQSRGGRSKASKEIQDIKQRLLGLADQVLDGSIDKDTGAVASQVLNVYLRAVSVELKVKEVTELEARLEQLEQAQAPRGRGSQWG